MSVTSWQQRRKKVANHKHVYKVTTSVDFEGAVWLRFKCTTCGEVWHRRRTNFWDETLWL